ncbi:HU family DNA-binding protein [Cellulomonas sp. JH27-2]|uniref:HU family DNA-binding protein n=1 Tax=Cellulomonas sp. JH27-2 TaxID=2774139 RepID=UPI0017834E97|nr:HU family DNA-binding protein [Cellulomonas sp. JH27-2]MBD8058338.1 HU family DNA-binding protein [Cellulomonas sp. JH27-2]
MPGKSQIADRIAARGWSRADAGSAVDAVLEEVTAALAAGERVTLTGFGTFEPVPRAARTARDPRTGAALDVAATTVARFHPGATLRARVRGAAPRAAGADDGPRRSGDAARPGAAARTTERRAAADRETGVPDPAEPTDTTKTIHRAKGADAVRVRSGEVRSSKGGTSKGGSRTNEAAETADGKAKAKVGSKAKAKAKARADSKVKARADSKKKAKAKADSKAKARSDSKAKAKLRTKAKATGKSHRGTKKS